MPGDREYLRQPADRGWWSLTLWLVIASVAAFGLQQVSYLAFPARSPFAVPPTDSLFALSLTGLKQGYFWQLLTFQFMHAGPQPWHLILNCWAIYVFGREVEEALGRGAFLILYLGSGVLGGLLQMAGAWAVPAQFGGEVVGASAGAFGLVAAFAALHPERVLTLLLFFVFPVRMRAKYLLFFSGVLAALGLVFPRFANLVLMGNVAHAAHLGGMLTGIACARWAAARLRLLHRLALGRRTQGLNDAEPVATLNEP